MWHPAHHSFLFHPKSNTMPHPATPGTAAGLRPLVARTTTRRERLTEECAPSAQRNPRAPRSRTLAIPLGERRLRRKEKEDDAPGVDGSTVAALASLSVTSYAVLKSEPVSWNRMGDVTTATRWQCQHGDQLIQAGRRKRVARRIGE